MRAAGKGNTEMVQTLLDAGANVNAKDKDGNTVLTYAVWNGHSDVIRMLKEGGGGKVGYPQAS